MMTTRPTEPATNEGRQVFRSTAIASVLATTALLAGCAATQGQPHPQDPFESFNRSMYSFNDTVDAAVLKPVATVYRDVTPEFARDGVNNFFGNLGEVWSFVNNSLQGQGQGAYNSVVRFTVNSVFGIGGLFDVASEAGIERRKQDFGQTLGRWGVTTGPYLVLPLLGPATVRDAVALPVDWFGDPLGSVNDIAVRNSLYGLQLVNKRARLLRASDMLDSVALDKYSLVRDVYLRSRIGGASANDGRLPDYDNDGKLPPDDESYGRVVPSPLPLLRR